MNQGYIDIFNQLNNKSTEETIITINVKFDMQTNSYDNADNLYTTSEDEAERVLLEACDMLIKHYIEVLQENNIDVLDESQSSIESVSPDGDCEIFITANTTRNQEDEVRQILINAPFNNEIQNIKAEFTNYRDFIYSYEYGTEYKEYNYSDVAIEDYNIINIDFLYT